MMATTHGFVGALLALPLYFIAPELFLTGLIAAFIGGVFPDLDLYHGHRKRLHYPIYYNVAVIATLPALLLYTSVSTVFIWFFLAAAGLHCFTDRFGGNKDSRPWQSDSQKAVYSHYHGRWWSPREWIRYDGSPEDFIVLLVASIPIILVLEGLLQQVGLLLVGISFFYVVFRKKGMEVIPNSFLRKVDS